MSALVPPLTDDDHVRGPADAPYELVMYGDFECPFCQAAQSILRRVEQRLEGQLRFGFRHFPIAEIHPHAERAAQWAEAAARQGRFWEAHDALYAQAGKLEDRDVVRALRRVVPDREALERDVDDPAVVEAVASGLASGEESGVQGTPAFFANGVQLEGAFDASSIVAALRAGDGDGAAA